MLTLKMTTACKTYLLLLAPLAMLFSRCSPIVKKCLRSARHEYYLIN